MLTDSPLHLIVWALLAFVLWLLISASLRRFRVQGPAVAAVLGWVIAGLCLWAGPIVVQRGAIWLRTERALMFRAARLVVGFLSARSR